MMLSANEMVALIRAAPGTVEGRPSIKYSWDGEYAWNIDSLLEVIYERGFRIAILEHLEPRMALYSVYIYDEGVKKWQRKSIII